MREDAVQLEAQRLRWREKPDHPMVSLPFDHGPAYMLRVLDRVLREEDADALAAGG